MILFFEVAEPVPEPVLVLSLGRLVNEPLNRVSILGVVALCRGVARGRARGARVPPPESWQIS